MADLPAPTAVTRSKAFWTLMAYAALIGLVMGVLAAAFIAVMDFGVDVVWGDIEISDPELFSGEWWFIPLVGAFGLVVGIVRKLLKVEPQIPGLFQEITEGRVPPSVVPSRVAVALVSLISGASVGPEAPLAAMGGGLGSWVDEKTNLPEDYGQSLTLTGMAGAFGGFFASPVIAALLVIEAATPKGSRRYILIAAPGLVSASVGFAVYAALVGGSLVDIYPIPPFEVDITSFLLAVPLGLFGAVIAALFGITMGLVKKAAMPLAGKPLILGLIGGLLIGIIGWAMPLTMFAGTIQLAGALERAPEFGAALLFLLVIGKIAATGLSFGTGFYGGPIFPLIFIGGVAGAAVHALIPSIPLGLAVACLFAAVPGSVAQIPFTLALLAALGLTITSPTQAAPAALATAIAFAVFTGFLDRRPPRAVAEASQADQPQD